MTTSLNDYFDRHEAWKREFKLRLRLLKRWLSDCDLLDAAVQQRVQRLDAQSEVNQLTVAFVGEFSRGKSELINAIFFADYGRRVVPAGVGRTTMCPTEIGYEPDLTPCLRLLPIETRLQPQSLLEWRHMTQKWQRIELSPNNPQQLSAALASISQTQYVTAEKARALGFNQPPNSAGLLEVPCWRHALVNLAHPLLKQGLVILDTPGLNAVGTEPELTINLIGQAQAVVFVLSADAGVTQSDLAIWHEHLLPEAPELPTRLVVLNKIDSLWDALDSTQEVQAQIEQQKQRAAETLGVAKSQVLALSAQKGLLGKIRQDDMLLKRSGLEQLEKALSQIMQRRHHILGAAVAQGVDVLRHELGHLLHMRKRDLTEQLLELGSLQGKNQPMIENMHQRVTHEQTEFNAAAVKIHATRAGHIKLSRELTGLLKDQAVKDEVAQLLDTLKQKGFKFGIKRAYSNTFTRLRANLQQVDARAQEIGAALSDVFLQLNAEYGFSLQAPAMLPINAYLEDLALIERSHVRYMSLGNALKLAQPDFAERLARALGSRLRAIFNNVLQDIQNWSQSGVWQLETQLRERRKNFVRRFEAIDRIAQASSGLEQQISQINARCADLELAERKLMKLADDLLQMSTPARFGLALHAA